MKLCRTFAVLAIALAAAPAADAAFTVRYTFTGNTGITTVEDPDGVPTGLSASQLVRGSGLTGVSANDGFNSSGWTETSLANALSGNDYLQFSLTTDLGYKLSLDNLVYNDLRSATGPPNIAVLYSLDGFATYTQIGSTYTPGTASAERSFGLSALSPLQEFSGTVMFRILGWGSTNAAGTYRLANNLEVSGSVNRADLSPVPAPPGLVMMCSAVGALGLGRVVRRLRGKQVAA